LLPGPGGPFTVEPEVTMRPHARARSDVLSGSGRSMAAPVAATLALVALLLAGAAPAVGQGSPDARQANVAGAVDGQAQEASLYERLGGVYPIASVVDVFIDLLLHNDVLNENPAIREARDRVPAPGLKYHVTAMVCQATGGPCEYTGRSMEEAHAHLSIGEREWQAMLSDLRRTLNDFQVPEQEQDELIAIVESTKDAIVVDGQ
jgi:hemoglobin